MRPPLTYCQLFRPLMNISTKIPESAVIATDMGRKILLYIIQTLLLPNVDPDALLCSVRKLIKCEE